MPIILALAGVGYWLTRARVVAMAGGDTRKLHSRPAHYGGWKPRC